MPQTFPYFVKSRAQPILLPRRSTFHSVADFAQALAHASAMLAAPFPFLTIAGGSARSGVVGLLPRGATGIVACQRAVSVADIPDTALNRRQGALPGVAVGTPTSRNQRVASDVDVLTGSQIAAPRHTLCRRRERPARPGEEQDRYQSSSLHNAPPDWPPMAKTGRRCALIPD